MRHDLQLLEQRWGLAVQSAGFGVWDLDVPGETVHYPPEWKALLGYNDADVPDPTVTWRSRVHPDDLPRMLDALYAHLGGEGMGYECEFRLRAADGSYRWVLSRGRVVDRGPRGEPLRAVGTLTDLTDRRQAERLRLERDRAEASSRAKTEFLARMSHELRTPLNAVLGFAQLLSTRGAARTAEEERRYLAHIEQAGWHLLHLVDDVLDLAQLENGRLEVESAPVALAPLVREAWEDVAASAQQREVRLLAPELPPAAAVQADAGRLRQVLAHLLGNAVKHNRRGGSVALETTATADTWTLAIVDTGPGIPAAQIAHLFEPFNRVGRGGANTEGVGIGLVLARSLVEAMAGRLTVRSTEGIGSSFAVTLPVARR